MSHLEYAKRHLKSLRPLETRLSGLMKPRFNSMAWMTCVMSGWNLAPSLQWSKGGSIMLWGCLSAAGTGRLVRMEGRKDERSKVERSLMKTCSRAHRISDWGKGSPSYRTTSLSTQPRQCRRCFGTSLGMSLSGRARQDLNLIEHLWRALKIAVQRHSPSNLTELERICREEWEKLPNYRCAMLVVL